MRFPGIGPVVAAILIGLFVQTLPGVGARQLDSAPTSCGNPSIIVFSGDDRPDLHVFFEWTVVMNDSGPLRGTLYANVSLPNGSKLTSNISVEAPTNITITTAAARDSQGAPRKVYFEATDDLAHQTFLLNRTIDCAAGLVSGETTPALSVRIIFPKYFLAPMGTPSCSDRPLDSGNETELCVRPVLDGDGRIGAGTAIEALLVGSPLNQSWIEDATLKALLNSAIYPATATLSYSNLGNPNVATGDLLGAPSLEFSISNSHDVKQIQGLLVELKNLRARLQELDALARDVGDHGPGATWAEINETYGRASLAFDDLNHTLSVIEAPLFDYLLDVKNRMLENGSILVRGGAVLTPSSGCAPGPLRIDAGVDLCVTIAEISYSVPLLEKRSDLLVGEPGAWSTVSAWDGWPHGEIVQGTKILLGTPLLDMSPFANISQPLPVGQRVSHAQTIQLMTAMKDLHQSWNQIRQTRQGQEIPTVVVTYREFESKRIEARKLGDAALENLPAREAFFETVESEAKTAALAAAGPSLTMPRLLSGLAVLGGLAAGAVLSFVVVRGQAEHGSKKGLFTSRGTSAANPLAGLLGLVGLGLAGVAFALGYAVRGLVFVWSGLP
ncbi:MAG: hypothetical protein HY556_04875 [Euryarchaeota archaeon]|nr:hypothetical protein [Euryarchaeota archaeon]